MFTVLVLGAGRIGTLITNLLLAQGDYEIFLADMAAKNFDAKRLQALPKDHQISLNVDDTAALHALFEQHEFSAVVSCLPFFKNEVVAKAAHRYRVHYFDLTEDRAVTQTIKRLAADADCAFVPQCGVAPGFIGMAAYDLMQSFETVKDVHLRVGALPEHSNHAFKYALTWSVEGLINEYAQMCDAIVEGEAVQVPPLTGLESITVDGVTYEAFNTSGGLGSLVELVPASVRNLNYKTIRYPGHQKILKLLMEDFKLKDDQTTLAKILRRAIPKTDEDVVLIYIRITGECQGEFVAKHDVRKLYPEMINGQLWSAIQVSTASSLCAVLHCVLTHPNPPTGFVYQETLSLPALMQGPFGQYLDKSEI